MNNNNEKKFFNENTNDLILSIINFLENQKQYITNPKADLSIKFSEDNIYTSKSCPFCGSASEYDMEYDSYYCPECNVWLEPICGSEDCMFCANRPERPLLK